MPSTTPIHIGNGVYVNYNPDSKQVELRTNSPLNDHVIYLEDFVLCRLMSFASEVFPTITRSIAQSGVLDDDDDCGDDEDFDFLGQRE
jgi:hypothetical protein